MPPTQTKANDGTAAVVVPGAAGADVMTTASLPHVLPATSILPSNPLVAGQLVAAPALLPRKSTQLRQFYKSLL